MAGEAARLGDPVGHSLGMVGMVGGAVAGALVGAALLGATVMTGGAAGVFAAAAIAGVVGGGALAGGKLFHGLQTVLGLANPTTGALSQGSPDVRVNGRPAIRAGVDFVASCSGLYGVNHVPRSTVRVAEGSKTVRVNGHPAGRVADRLECAATITEGSPDVRFGGATEAVLAVHDDEADAKAFAQVLLLVGAVGAAGLAGLAGGVAGVLKLGAVVAGFSVLDEGVGLLGDQIGPGWRDTLQGTLELGSLVAGGRKAKSLAEEPPARAAARRATRERVEANLAESRAARQASNFGGAPPAPGTRATTRAQWNEQSQWNRIGADPPAPMRRKILLGERRANPASPGGMSNELIGGHSPRITTHPDYVHEVVSQNPDGTTNVKFITQFADGRLSKLKSSTLAPEHWSDQRIIHTTNEVAGTPPVATRARDGATLHRSVVDGVQWEVIRDATGRITSSYPTGSTPTPNF